MDYTIIDISSLSDNEIKVGDWIELIGNNISLENLSLKAGTISYEILTNLSSRIERRIVN